MKMTFETIHQGVSAVLEEIENVIVGKQGVLKQIMATILADGTPALILDAAALV